VLTRNYGEAGALELFGHGLPPIASGQVTFRYWRPPVGGQRAVLVGFTPGEASFCRGYQAVARIQLPDARRLGGWDSNPAPAAFAARGRSADRRLASDSALPRLTVGAR
jgi:hypothetical protein